MIKVLINGISGRMGQEVAKEIDCHENLFLSSGFDIQNNGLYPYPVYTNFDEIEEKPDVIIDFSVPIATLNILEYAQKENIPIVIATTGFSDEQIGIIKEYSKKVPIFHSGNMSYDINVMSKVVSHLAKLLKDTDIEIVESHHNRKIDAPSGTALMLADSINDSLDHKMEYVYNRHNHYDKRQKNEIGISAIRGGNIVGEHTVMFIGEHESFEVKHISYSRSVFAEGALKAAKFIVGKENGYYNMDDLIN